MPRFSRAPQPHNGPGKHGALTHTQYSPSVPALECRTETFAHQVSTDIAQKGAGGRPSAGFPPQCTRGAPQLVSRFFGSVGPPRGHCDSPSSACVFGSPPFVPPLANYSILSGSHFSATVAIPPLSTWFAPAAPILCPALAYGREWRAIPDSGTTPPARAGSFPGAGSS